MANVSILMMDNFKQEWSVAVTQPNSRNGKGRNKLRTYSQFKTEFCAEAYCKVILPLSHIYIYIFCLYHI